MDDSRPSPVELVPALGVALLLATGAWVALRAVAWNADFFHDDAYITLRYAQNWLAGNGVGWNPGDRVEGYTNFLQLLLATGLGAAGVDLVRAARCIGAAAWLGLAVLGAVRVRRAGPWAAIPVVWVGASIPLIAWVFGGLEAPLVALWLTAGALTLQDALQGAQPLDARRVRGGLAAAGAAFGLALLTRPDAVLFLVPAIVVVGWAAPRRNRAAALAALLLPVVALVLPWLAFKLLYYGSLLPNTWWVKGADPSGWRLAGGLRYLGALAIAPPFPLLWLAAGGLRAWGAGRLDRADVFGLTALSLQLAFVAYVGGDQMPLFRLGVPMLPVAVWLAFRLWLPDLRRLGPSGGALAWGVASGLVALPLVWPTLAGPHRNATSFVGAAVGRYVADAWRPGSLVALNTAGSTPYHAPGLRYLDMLGLNDAHIARRPIERIRIAGQRLPGHAKGDGDYVLDQQPDYIVLGPAAGVPASHPWFLSDLEIAADPRFARDYVLRRAILDVRGLPEHRAFDETRDGSLLFTWYERLRR